MNTPTVIADIERALTAERLSFVIAYSRQPFTVLSLNECTFKQFCAEVVRMPDCTQYRRAQVWLQRGQFEPFRILTQ